MAFKDLHKLKKIQEVQKENIEIDFLIVGHDIYSIAIYHDLVNKHGEDKVRLLSQEKFEIKDLAPKGPSAIRGIDNIAYIKENFNEEFYQSVNLMGQFYKDMQWKSFGGRSKSEALKFQEEHFTKERIDLYYHKVFAFMHAEGFLESLNEKSYAVRLKNISKAENRFIVECVNGTEFVVQNLIFGLTPAEFLKFYKNKNELSAKFVEFAESTFSPSALYVRFDFKKPLTDMKETLHIPLSYTHEWGHFVGEFRNLGTAAQDGQSVDFVHFLDKDQMTEEDISRIIRLLKKNLEKIFSDSKILPCKEYISIEDSTGCPKIDDLLFSEIQNEVKNIFFIGNCAPMVATDSINDRYAYSIHELSFEARALCSLHTLRAKLIN